MFRLINGRFLWSRLSESNRRPSHYEFDLARIPVVVNPAVRRESFVTTNPFRWALVTGRGHFGDTPCRAGNRFRRVLSVHPHASWSVHDNQVRNKRLRTFGARRHPGAGSNKGCPRGGKSRPRGSQLAFWRNVFTPANGPPVTA